MDIFRSQYHRDMGVGVLNSGQQTTNHEPSLALPSHTLATIIDDPSNPNPKRCIFKTECHRDMEIDLYHSYWQAAFGGSSLAADKPLPSNQTVYPSNRLAKAISLLHNVIET